MKPMPAPRADKPADKPAGRPAAPPAAAPAPPAAAAAPARPGPPPYLQARLAVSQPGDPAEREAEQTARAVVQDLRPGAVPHPGQPGAPTRLFRAPARPSQKPPADAARGQQAPAPVEQAVDTRRRQSAGMPLPEALRERLAPRFGDELAGVRVHVDEEAAALCRRMNAGAFTVGRDLYFAAGAWQPDRDDGVELIAHELTHVLQQGASPGEPQGAALQRDFWDWLGGTPDAPADPLAPLRTRFAEAEAWAGAGPYPAAPLTMVGAGGFGGFDAQYLADASTGHGTLRIAQGVAVVFNDTLVDNAGVVQAHATLPAGDGSLAALAGRIQRLRPAARSRALAAYQWTAAEQAPWLARVEGVVEGAWSGRFDFFLNQPQWNWLGAEVRVQIDIGARAQAATDHMTVNAYKLPEGGNLNDFDIDNVVRSGSAADARDQTLQVGSTAVDPNAFNLLRRSVYFAHGRSTLTAAARAELDDWVIRYNGAPGHVAHQDVPIELVGHTSAAGSVADNDKLAQERIDAVQLYLGANGFTNAAARLTPVPRGEAEADPRHPNRATDQRVDILVDHAPRQVVMAHEFGHALGLGDEYGSGGLGGTAGTTPQHDAWARAMTHADGTHLPGVVRERNGGIMASGNEVRPHHYAVFHHALETVTGHTPWSLGLTVPKWRVQLDCGLPGVLNDRPPPAPTDPLGDVPVMA